MADTFSYLGFLYRDKKEWKKAEEYFEHGHLLLEELKDERGIATLLNNLGVLYKHKGDLGKSYKRRKEWEKAIDYFQRSLKIVEKVGDEMNVATTMYELVLLYEDMEKYREAIELLEKIVKICEQVGHPDLRIRKSKEILERVKRKQDSGLA
jgi:tetratricopeptide (TPR) repeat protein